MPLSHCAVLREQLLEITEMEKQGRQRLEGITVLPCKVCLLSALHSSLWLMMLSSVSFSMFWCHPECSLIVGPAIP